MLFYAENAFDDRYTEEQLRTWLATFLRRFVGGQFKRSVAPEAAANHRLRSFFHGLFGAV